MPLQLNDKNLLRNPQPIHCSLIIPGLCAMKTMMGAEGQYWLASYKKKKTLKKQKDCKLITLFVG